ncbi:MAG: PEP-CTERM sorting domain-containing protein [Phycisphaerales bacterium]|nr:PEP-CTERM sorting domain-containing protein [Phycisphaerales bacterium]MCB9862700.1 PEP-CTERM sorting domain-containing protein [Phycisphaerales bacterium]
MFRTGITSIRTTAVLIAAFALMAVPRLAMGADLDVTDLFVSYDVQTATSASGSITFNLRFASAGGGAGGYDVFSSQVLISRMGIGANAKFTLDEPATEDTGAIGAAYWLPAPPTTFQNASTIGSEFRFTDFVSVAQDITPQPGDIVARFVVQFHADDATQLGTFQVTAGNSAFNYFNSDFVNRYDNTINSASFDIVGVPEPSTLLPLLASLIVLRRRR